MSYPITLHYNTGGAEPWDNPNLYPGDINGNPVTPQSGVECYLWAKPANIGSTTLQFVEVTFFVLPPSGSLVWPDEAHGSNSVPSLDANQQTRIGCSVPWVPDSSQNSHQCLAAVVSCLDCPAPSTTPGTPVNYNDSQTAQHNVTINTVSAKQAVSRPFRVNAPASAGYVEMTREPLSENKSVLTARGISPDSQEAPREDFNITNESGEDLGTKVPFEKDETLLLFSQVTVREIRPGNVAVYHIKHYENGELKGGVSHIVQHI